MPANLSPEYKKAEQAFRSAREPRERLQCLREMLRTIPRHKGTEHIQADIKSRIRQLTEGVSAPHKGPARSASAHTIRREGAAQVCLIGPPNAGKSSLHAVLTGSTAEVGPFPYTTREPLPGMLAFEDVAFQLIDLPPISPERMEPWIADLLKATDAVWLGIDLSDPSCPDHAQIICTELARRKITLSAHWPARKTHPATPAASAATAAKPTPSTLRLPPM